MLAAYLAAGIAVTWPRVATGPGRVPAVRDISSYVWALWWVAHQAVHLANPWFTGSMAAPVGIQLGYDTTMPLLGVLLAPVTLTAGPAAAFWLITIVLPGLLCYVMYLTARLWLGPARRDRGRGAVRPGRHARLAGLVPSEHRGRDAHCARGAGRGGPAAAFRAPPRRGAARRGARRLGADQPGDRAAGRGDRRGGADRSGGHWLAGRTWPPSGQARRGGPGRGGGSGGGQPAADRDGPAGPVRRRVRPAGRAGRHLSPVRGAAARPVRAVTAAGQRGAVLAGVRLSLPAGRRGRPGLRAGADAGRAGRADPVGSPRRPRAVAAQYRVAAGRRVAGQCGAGPGPDPAPGHPHVRSAGPGLARRPGLAGHAVHLAGPGARAIRVPRGGPAGPGRAGRRRAAGRLHRRPAGPRRARAPGRPAGQRAAGRCGRACLGRGAGNGLVRVPAPDDDPRRLPGPGPADRGRLLQLGGGGHPVRAARRYPAVRVRGQRAVPAHGHRGRPPAGDLVHLVGAPGTPPRASGRTRSTPG